MSVLLRTLAAAPLALAITLLSTAPAEASYIYSYTGQVYQSRGLSGPTAPADVYTLFDRVTGQFELAAPIAANLTALTAITPLSFSFSDGVNTFTHLTATFAFLSVRTDAAGAISQWEIGFGRNNLPGGGGSMRTLATLNVIDQNGASTVYDYAQDRLCGPTSSPNICALFGDPFYEQSAQNSRRPGTWTVRETAPVPEPSSMALLGLAFAGLAARRRAR